MAKKMSKREEIERLVDKGYNTKDIAQKTGANPSYVSTVKNQYLREKSWAEGDKLPEIIVQEIPAPKPDNVNSPQHYTAGGIETIDFIEAKRLNFRLANVVKYVSRAPFKGNALEDLEKARWYLDREIAVHKRATVK